MGCAGWSLNVFSRTDCATFFFFALRGPCFRGIPPRPPPSPPLFWCLLGRYCFAHISISVPSCGAVGNNGVQPNSNMPGSRRRARSSGREVQGESVLALVRGLDVVGARFALARGHFSRTVRVVQYVWDGHLPRCLSCRSRTPTGREPLLPRPFPPSSRRSAVGRFSVCSFQSDRKEGDFFCSLSASTDCLPAATAALLQCSRSRPILILIDRLTLIADSGLARGHKARQHRDREKATWYLVKYCT